METTFGDLVRTGSTKVRIHVIFAKLENKKLRFKPGSRALREIVVSEDSPVLFSDIVKMMRERMEELQQLPNFLLFTSTQNAYTVKGDRLPNLENASLTMEMLAELAPDWDLAAAMYLRNLSRCHNTDFYLQKIMGIKESQPVYFIVYPMDIPYKPTISLQWRRDPQDTSQWEELVGVSPFTRLYDLHVKESKEPERAWFWFPRNLVAYPNCFYNAPLVGFEEFHVL